MLSHDKLKNITFFTKNIFQNQSPKFMFLRESDYIKILLKYLIPLKKYFKSYRKRFKHYEHSVYLIIPSSLLVLEKLTNDMTKCWWYVYD